MFKIFPRRCHSQKNASHMPMNRYVSNSHHTELPCSPSPAPTASIGVLSFPPATSHHIHPVNASVHARVWVSRESSMTPIPKVPKQCLETSIFSILCHNVTPRFCNTTDWALESLKTLIRKKNYSNY